MKSNIWPAVLAVAVVATAVMPVAATPNNGFETDYVYVARDPGQGGQLRMYRESDGTQVADLLPDGTNWLTLTFAGTGDNDARLFVAKIMGADVQIDQVDASGQTVNTAMLSAIVGGAVGSAIELGNLRFSAYHNTLFLALNPDYNSSTPATVYEVDLGLTTRIHTYVGPNVVDRRVNVDINSRTGQLYMTGRHLGGVTNQGDVLAFATAGRTVGGTTSTFTTLIDGPSYAAIDGRWNQPSSPIFRKRAGNGEDDTLVILLNPGSGAAPELEFWLDTAAHPSGNPNYLALRGSPISAPRGWNGQQDDVTGHVWFGALRGGFHVVRADDTTSSYETSRQWFDADSPFAPGPFAPVIAEVVPDPQLAASGGEYVQQLGLLVGTAPITWSVVQGPTGTQVDSGGKVSGWTPTATDVGQTITFEVKAENAVSFDTETWQVDVIQGNNGFPTDYVFVVRSPGNGGQLRMYNRSDGTRIAELLPDGTNWMTATFSGTGRDDDARLFLAKLDNGGDPTQTGTDIILAEVDFVGNTLNSANLSTIIGGPVGTAVALGNLRYSNTTDTLMLGLNPNVYADSTAVAYEIDLDLSTRIHTYLGEAVGVNAVDAAFNGRVTVAVGPRNGILYMTSQNLGDLTGSGLGDVLAFDTSGRAVGGTTSTFSVLIDGQTRNAADGDYFEPSTPIYRRRGGGDDTLLIPTNTDINTGVLEFYLNTALHPVDTDGNLAERTGLNLSIGRGWNGQQEPGSGEVWLGAMHFGFHLIAPNDATASYETSSPGRQWTDAAVPPLASCNEPFADIDADQHVDQDDFAALQRCINIGGGGYPEGCACFDRARDGEIDAFDVAEFMDCATGPGVIWDPVLVPDCEW